MSSESSFKTSVSSAGEQSTSCEFERLCLKIYKKLGIPLNEELAVAIHSSATKAMLCARDLLTQGRCEVSSIARTALLCAGIACMRRVHAETESVENAKLVRTTAVLLFSLLVMSEPGIELEDERYEAVTVEMQGAQQPPDHTLRDDERCIREWSKSALANRAFLPETDKQKAALSGALYSDSYVSRAALREARRRINTRAMSEVRELADLFFRCSAATMMEALINKAMPVNTSEKMCDTSFLTLDTTTLMNEANEQQGDKLAALVSAAESEVGQAVLRDMILSFKLPVGVAGLRRTLLLPREVNQTASQLYTEVVNAAHEAAMRGADWSWKSDPDPIHRVSAVLAGLAIILAKTPDLIRKGDAFAGRVSLPFLETVPPDNRVTRLAFMPTTTAWVVYSVGSDGEPRVQASKTGFDGFCEIVLLFASKC